MTAALRSKNRDVEIAIVVSVALHVLLLFWVVLQMGRSLAGQWAAMAVAEPVEEVTLLYPEQILLPPEPKEEPKQFIRTSQNTAAATAPEKADFVSDRNTLAASELPAAPDGDKAMPTQEGIDLPTRELADRDYKDGEIKEDGATPEPLIMPPAEPAPAAPPPSPMVASVEPAPPPAPDPPPPVEVAKTEPVTPLEAMMRERDESDMARITTDRLPLEVRTAETPDKPEEPNPNEPPPPQPPAPDTPPVVEMRQPEADSIPRAVPVPDPVTRTAGPRDAESFSPFTRTSKARGTLSNRGETAVNAAETPVGRYMRTVTGAVEKKWHTLRRRHADAVTFGNLKLRFYVLPDGNVVPPTILSDPKSADPRMVDFTLRAILEAEIPPIPQDLLPLLEGRRLEVEYDVLIY